MRTFGIASCVMAMAAGLGGAFFGPTVAVSQSERAGDSDERPEFTDVFGEPLNVNEPIEGETFTDAVTAFHASGDNPHIGDEAAISEGEELFVEHCSACHGQSAEGGMGPSLIDDVYANARVETVQGMFEVIHGGAAGAMPAFGEQLKQDEMLQIIAYIESQGGI